ncbi:MAG: hypothetical protein GY771_17180 [bacterium]|nr:hypothetical protein [bacterium]
MKTISYFTFAFVALTAAVSATVYGDDFESYPVGYDIANSPDWTDEYSDINHLVVDEQGGNKIIRDEMDEPAPWPVYGYTPPGIIADSRISFDLLFADDWTYTSASYRLSSGSYRGYVITYANDVDFYLGYGDYVMVGYRDANGIGWNGENMFFIGDYFDVDTWYHIDGLLDGTHPPNYDITVNGDLSFMGVYHGGVPYGDEGLCGISVTSIQRDVYIDNFEVDDDPVITGIKSASLGEIKASFR